MSDKVTFWFPLAMFAVLVIGLSPYAVFKAPLIPGLALAWIYHWVLYRPQQLPPFALVFIGLIYDLSIENPLGLSPLLFLASYLAIIYSRKSLAPRPFFYIWGGFILFSFLNTVVNWTLSCLFTLHLVNPLPLITSMILAVIVYPFLSRGMIFIQKRSHV